jgi:2-amino-4-hydroxy-6-hydroxymethyldihydropteridine diphosphokinase
LKRIEADLGRDLSGGAQRNGPRPIDIDILALAAKSPPRQPEDYIIVETPTLVVPHPRLAERAFALFPLRDIAPDIPHPILRQTIAELADQVAEQDIIRTTDAL